MTPSATNPFSSCFLKPGANSYLFVPEENTNSVEEFSRQRVSQLVSCLLASSDRRFCIVGPHGTGKSTLLVQIMSDNQIREQPHARVQLSSDSREFTDLWKLQNTVQEGVFAVDGYEQLDFVSKLRLLMSSWQRRQTLIVTVHEKPRGFKVLHQTSRTQEMDAQIVHRLLGSSGKADELLKSSFWRDSKERHGQNLRESLFDAYDWFEAQQS